MFGFISRVKKRYLTTVKTIPSDEGLTLETSVPESLHGGQIIV